MTKSRAVLVITSLVMLLVTVGSAIALLVLSDVSHWFTRSAWYVPARHSFEGPWISEKTDFRAGTTTKTYTLYLDIKFTDKDAICEKFGDLYARSVASSRGKDSAAKAFEAVQVIYRTLGIPESYLLKLNSGTNEFHCPDDRGKLQFYVHDTTPPDTDAIVANVNAAGAAFK